METFVVMRTVLLILFLAIGINFLTNNKSGANCGGDAIQIENLFNSDDASLPTTSQENFISYSNVSNNNKAFDVTNAYNFFSRLCDRYNRINTLLSEETLAYLKSLIKQKSSFQLSLSCTKFDSSTSLYKLLNPCDYYTYHNHRIII